MIGIYHKNDLDGICSGAIMKYKYPDIKLIGFDNGDVLDVKIAEDEEVIIADISLPMANMKGVSLKTKGKFTWIDHHKSSMVAYKHFIETEPFEINIVHEIGVAACELTWRTLFPDIPVPIAVQLLSAYDVWNKSRFDWDKMTLPFQYGMKLDCGSNINNFNTNVFKIDFETGDYNNLFQVIYNSGISIAQYQKDQNTLHANIQWFEENVLGYKAICINDNTHTSFVFDSVYDENKHDMMLLFYYAKNRWTFSVYTSKDNVDCSVIAKHFGGGGHKKAAGFKVNNLSTVFTNKEF